MKYLVEVDPRINLVEPEKNIAAPTYITFSGPFTEESARKFREELESAETHAAQSKQKVLPVVIDSYGGSVYALLSMIDTIQNCKLKVATIVEGKAMSCGAILFSCGAEGHRYVGPNATVLIHDVASWVSGKEAEIRASADETTRLNTKVYRLMAKNCGHKDKDYFNDIVAARRGADWYLSPEECLKHNLANHVGLPEVKMNINLDYTFGLPKKSKKKKKNKKKKK